MSDLDLRALERACLADPSDDDAFEALNAARERAGLPLLCAECREGTDEREENCDCDSPLCASCHDAAMEHGHENVHDEDDPCQCCPDCYSVMTWPRPTALCSWPGCIKVALGKGECFDHARAPWS